MVGEGHRLIPVVQANAKMVEHPVPAKEVESASEGLAESHLGAEARRPDLHGEVRHVDGDPPIPRRHDEEPAAFRQPHSQPFRFVGMENREARPRVHVHPQVVPAPLPPNFDGDDGRFGVMKNRVVETMRGQIFLLTAHGGRPAPPLPSTAGPNAPPGPCKPPPPPPFHGRPRRSALRIHR